MRWIAREFKLFERIQAIVLENERWELTLLPGKGCEIHQIRCKKTGVALLYTNDLELEHIQKDVNADCTNPIADYVFAGIIMMFPNGGVATQYQGLEYDYHGDIRSLAWQYEIAFEEDEFVIYLEIRSQQLPLALHRAIRCKEERILFEDRITRTDANLNGNADEKTSHAKIPFIYGLHPYFTAPLLDEEHGILKIGGKQIVQMPMDSYKKQELMFFTEKSLGLLEVYNPKLSLGFMMEYDASFMPYVWLYIDKHVAKEQRILSLIPCTTDTHDGVAETVSRGNAVWIERGQVLSTAWSIILQG